MSGVRLMKQKFARGVVTGTTLGATFGYLMFYSNPGALGLACSVTACILGAQFGFAPDQDDE